MSWSSFKQRGKFKDICHMTQCRMYHSLCGSLSGQLCRVISENKIDLLVFWFRKMKFCWILKKLSSLLGCTIARSDFICKALLALLRSTPFSPVHWSLNSGTCWESVSCDWGRAWAGKEDTGRPFRFSQPTLEALSSSLSRVTTRTLRLQSKQDPVEMTAYQHAPFISL